MKNRRGRIKNNMEEKLNKYRNVKRVYLLKLDTKIKILICKWTIVY